MARNLKKEYKKKKGANKDASASPPKPQPMKTSVKGRKQVDGGGEDIMASEPSLLEEVADVSSVALKNIEDKGAVDSPAEIRRKLALRIHKLRDVYPAVIDVSNLGSLIVKNEEGKFLDFEKFTCGLEKSLVDIFRDDNKITVVSDAQEKKVLSITRGEVPLKGKQREKEELELLEILASETKTSFDASETSGEPKRGRRRNHAGHPGGPVASAHEFHRFPGHGNPYMMDPYFYGGGYGGHPYYGGFGGYGAYGGPGRPGNSGRGRGGRGRGGKLN